MRAHYIQRRYAAREQFRSSELVTEYKGRDRREKGHKRDQAMLNEVSTMGDRFNEILSYEGKGAHRWWKAFPCPAESLSHLYSTHAQTQNSGESPIANGIRSVPLEGNHICCLKSPIFPFVRELARSDRWRGFLDPIFCCSILMIQLCLMTSRFYLCVWMLQMFLQSSRMILYGCNITRLLWRWIDDDDDTVDLNDYTEASRKNSTSSFIFRVNKNTRPAY